MVEESLQLIPFPKELIIKDLFMSEKNQIHRFTTDEVEIHNNQVYEIINYIQNKVIDNTNNECLPPFEVWDSDRLSVKCGAQDCVLESLCRNIEDFELVLPLEIYQKLLQECHYFGLNEEYWKDIKHE